MITRRDRALGAIYGPAIGDSLGMPTQSLSRPVIRQRCGVLVGFHSAAPEHPVAAGLLNDLDIDRVSSREPDAEGIAARTRGT